MTPVRLLSRLILVACLSAVTFLPPAQSTAAVKGEQPSAGIYPEVRLRKLHLVRPDLIPYPIAYEVCC